MNFRGLSFVVCIMLQFFFQSVDAKTPLPASRLEQLSGVRSTKNTKQVWDKKYGRTVYIYGKAPSKFLAENFNVIPAGSSVLDMGIGEGRNAVFLAKKGYQVTGVDISSVAIKKAHLLAKEYGVRIKTIVGDLSKYKIKAASYDAIICFYYVDRSIVKRMISWLRPGGILIYEAHLLKQQKQDGGEPSYYLKDQELLTLFKGMKVVKFEEPIDGQEYTSSIILKK